MEGKQGVDGRASGGSSGGSSFLKHCLSPRCYWCYIMENGVAPRHDRCRITTVTNSGAGLQPLVWRRTAGAPARTEGSGVQRWSVRRQFIEADDGQERVEGRIQSRNIQRNRGHGLIRESQHPPFGY